MKKNYELPEILLILIPFDDIITASGNDDIANDIFSITSPEIYR